MEILREIQERRSTQSFASDPVEKDQLERILHAGRLAPSAKNRQEWRFIVARKDEVLENLRDAAFRQENAATAPIIVAACTTNIDYHMPNGQLSYPIDISLAVGFMMLQATHEGLGSCCISTFDEQEVKELLSVPFQMRVVLLLAIGHSADGELPERSRKSLKQIVSYNHW